MPCTENFETQALTAVTLQFLRHQRIRADPLGVDDVRLLGLVRPRCSRALLPGISDIFNAGTLGGELAQTRMRSADGTPAACWPSSRKRTTTPCNSLTARSAQNGHMIGELNVMDLITIPTGQGNDATP